MSESAKRKAVVRKRKRTDPKIRERADELHQSGMPFQMAMAVAQGRMELNEALVRLAEKQRIDKLMRLHDFSRALATQIVMGHADCDAVLTKRRMQEHRKQNKMRSSLDEAAKSGKEIALSLHGKRRVRGVITSISAYTFEFKDVKADLAEIHKLEVQYAYDPADWKRVRKVLKVDKAVSVKGLDPVSRPQDRYTCSDKRLFRYLDENADVSITCLGGDTFRGRVAWFGRFEFGVTLRTNVELTVFRHALFRIAVS